MQHDSTVRDGWASRARRRALVLAVTVQGVSGVIGGAWLVGDPSGGSIGLPLELLAGSVFPSYRVPGVILLTLLGVAPLLVAYGLIRSRPWSWTAATMVGLALLGWLGVQILVVGYRPDPPLQLLYGLLALVIVAMSLWPRSEARGLEESSRRALETRKHGPV